MANLLEQYKSRLAVAEKYYAQQHNGARLSEGKKMVVAKCLENVNKFINEAFSNSVGTQRSDLGMFKRFALNLTNVALPNLISHDLVIVHPMSSLSGYINYIEYTTGSNKGQVKQGDVINSPFGLGNVDPDYTSARVVETVTLAGDGTATLAWAPIYDGDDAASKAAVVGSEGATVQVVDAKTGKIKVTGASGEVKIKYVYDNVVIPQNDIPIVNARMQSIPLIAKARRIAVYYSQIAAFQAKTDYGFDLGDQLAEKAVGELSYEIDTEVTQLLIDNADEDARLVWSKTLPVGVSKAEHYEGFTEILGIGTQIVYDRTKRFAPNYMLVASNVLPILRFIKGFTAAPTGSINGPYFAGTLDHFKVFVTPNIEPGKFVIGVNGDDMMSSAAVYAPYMAIVPTQLLQYADGGTSQGWSTLYDLKLLNKNLLVSGRITD